MLYNGNRRCVVHGTMLAPSGATYLGARLVHSAAANKVKAVICRQRAAAGDWCFSCFSQRRGCLPACLRSLSRRLIVSPLAISRLLTTTCWREGKKKNNRHRHSFASCDTRESARRSGRNQPPRAYHTRQPTVSTSDVSCLVGSDRSFTPNHSPSLPCALPYTGE